MTKNAALTNESNNGSSYLTNLIHQPSIVESYTIYLAAGSMIGQGRPNQGSVHMSNIVNTITIIDQVLAILNDDLPLKKDTLPPSFPAVLTTTTMSRRPA